MYVRILRYCSPQVLQKHTFLNAACQQILPLHRPWTQSLQRRSQHKTSSTCFAKKRASTPNPTCSYPELDEASVRLWPNAAWNSCSEAGAVWVSGLGLMRYACGLGLGRDSIVTISPEPRTCEKLYENTNTHTRTHTHTHMQRDAYTHRCTHIHTSMHTYIYIYIYIHTHTYIHTYVQMHLCIHTHLQI